MEYKIVEKVKQVTINDKVVATSKYFVKEKHFGFLKINATNIDDDDVDMEGLIFMHLIGFFIYIVTFILIGCKFFPENHISYHTLFYCFLALLGYHKWYNWLYSANFEKLLDAQNFIKEKIKKRLETKSTKKFTKVIENYKIENNSVSIEKDNS